VKAVAKLRGRSFLIGLVMPMLVACGVSGSSSGSPSAPGPTASLQTSATGATSGVGALAGTWESDAFTAADVDAVVRRRFSGPDVDRWERVSGCYPKTDDSWVTVLEFAGGQLVISTAVDGRSPQEGWTGSYTPQDANTFRADGYIAVDFRLEKGRLFTDLIKDAFPHPAQRLGDTMCQATIYDIAPFTRVG
jgi:hypothetical protein